MKLNYGEYLEKVKGCWAGKNIGGTLGAPMEGQMRMHDVSFYPQELNGATRIVAGRQNSPLPENAMPQM